MAARYLQNGSAKKSFRQSSMNLARMATPHWCRHTAASRMKVAGVDELAVKRILGHADKDVTEHYTHTDIDFLSKEIRKVL